MLRILLWLLCASAAQAGPDAHEHGKAKLGVALDSDMLSIDLDAPAESLVGFERAPSTDAQRTMLATVVEQLRQGTGLFAVPVAAGCRLQSSAVGPPEFTPSGHADFEASWQFRCSNLAAVQWVEVGLFTRYPALEQIAVSALSAAGQKAVVLTPGTIRILVPR